MIFFLKIIKRYSTQLLESQENCWIVLYILKPLLEKNLFPLIVESYRFECFLYLFQGFTYDHVELNVYLNGENLNCPLYGIKGTVYPCFYGK